MSAIIEVENLTKWYGNTRALDRVSFQVEKGRIVGFLGPNGAGKSTTLRILTGYLPATSGAARVAGYDVLTDSLAVRSRIGYMPENVPLYPEMRVDEYLRFRAGLKGVPATRRRAAVDKVLEQCWLSDRRRSLIGALSKGYRQRVGLADALVSDPPVLILDEPTIGLDPTQIGEVRRLIQSLAERHTVLLSSHILPEVEKTCSHLVIIADGRIKAAGTVEDLKRGLQQAHRVVMELKAPADDEKTGEGNEEIVRMIGQIEGTGTVTVMPVDGGWLRILVYAAPGSDPREHLSAMAARRGWKLRELRRELATLEEIYARIVAGDAAATDVVAERLTA